MSKLYCIEITREVEEMMVVHHRFDKEPSRQDALDFIKTLDCGYDDNYGRFDCYEIKE